MIGIPFRHIGFLMKTHFFHIEFAKNNSDQQNMDDAAITARMPVRC